jgi:hypothetical protein
MIDYEAQIARYANPPNHELEQMIWLGIITVFVVFMFIIKKTNPKLHEKINNTIWGVMGILFLFWLIGKWNDKDKK